MDDQLPSARPPVFLGCLAMASALFAFVVVIVLAVQYFESGATARAVLDDAESYPVGTYEFVPEHNIFIVRLRDGTHLALDDLDAANRANPAVRCRVQPVTPAMGASFTALRDQYARRMSPDAAGANLVFRETCNGAVYDYAGIRLDADGPNLDRHNVAINDDGRLTVNVVTRECSERTDDDLSAPRTC